MAYPLDIEDKICEQITQGYAIHAFCNGKNGFPTEQAVYLWFRDRPLFFEKYERARAMRAEARFNKIDQYKEQVIAGTMLPDVARVIIDTEKWQAGKESPKYADKAAQNNVQINVNAGASAEDVKAIDDLLDMYSLPGGGDTQLIEHAAALDTPIIKSAGKKDAIIKDAIIIEQAQDIVGDNS
jgi:hypothetical protein